MEEDEEQKFVCKICSKRLFNGHSLGGHMRSHLPTIPAKNHDDHNETHVGKECIDDIDSSYGLRENPKKTWRNSDAKNQCKECGKEFQSMRALSGHMRCHSEKEWACKQCGKGFGSNRALFGHMRHHTKRSPEKQSEELESLRPVRRKRSKLRYKVSPNLFLSNSNASSLDVSEADELEEAALSLIMLSRGLTNSDEFNSLLKSSENNSFGVVVCDFDVENGKKRKTLRGRLVSCALGSWNSLCDKNECELGELGSGFSMSCENKAELGVPIGGLSEFGVLDSWVSINKLEEKVELGGSIDWYCKSDETKKTDLDDDFENELYDYEIESGNDPTEVALVREVGLLDQDDFEMMKSNSSKEATFNDQEDPEFGGNFCDSSTKKIVASFSGIFESSKPEYKCRTCNRIFPSYRALGGHRSGYKTTSCGLVVKIGSHERDVESILFLKNSGSDVDVKKLECNENAVEEVGFSELKKSKDHECPICFKVFPSGQALGGHKRAHYSKETVSEKEEEVSELHIVYDLNLPAFSLEDEADVNVGFKPWWLGSDRERKPLVISN